MLLLLTCEVNWTRSEIFTLKNWRRLEIAKRKAGIKRRNVFFQKGLVAFTSTRETRASETKKVCMWSFFSSGFTGYFSGSHIHSLFSYNCVHVFLEREYCFICVHTYHDFFVSLDNMQMTWLFGRYQKKKREWAKIDGMVCMCIFLLCRHLYSLEERKNTCESVFSQKKSIFKLKLWLSKVSLSKSFACRKNIYSRSLKKFRPASGAVWIGVKKEINKKKKISQGQKFM